MNDTINHRRAPHTLNRNAGLVVASMALALCGSTAHAQSQQAELREQVESTFDPQGPFDHDHLQKNPGYDDADERYRFELDGAADERMASGGAVSNDSCNAAELIPGSIADWNSGARLTTAAEPLLFCQPSEDCGDPSGNTNGVYFSYTPDQDGFIDLRTDGSNYDTVLSVFDGCAVFVPPFGCNQSTELACNDDQPFGNPDAQLLNLEVEAGATYIIKVSDRGPVDGGGVMILDLAWRPRHELCSNARPINGIAFAETVQTQNVITEQCEAEEDCEFDSVGVSNSVWYSYTPACDGTISINTYGSTYDTVLSVFDGCGAWGGIDAPCANIPTQLGCDDDSGVGLDSEILDIPVSTDETYIIKVSDYNVSQGGGTLELNFLFNAGEAPIAEITAPTPFECVCGQLSVEGTAAVPGGQMVEYNLEYRSTSDPMWTEISTNSAEVSGGVLGTLDISDLPQGHYFVRLTVQNGCGESNTAMSMFFLDGVFDDFEVTSPNEQTPVVGGDVCVLGTIWDRCFGEYRVDYRDVDSTIFNPVDATQPVYTNVKINEELARWRTVTDGIADGGYVITVDAVDQFGGECEHPESREFEVTVDNTLPVTAITDPVNCADVAPGSVVDIYGTVSDANMAGWILEYTGGNANSWIPITTGSTSIQSGLLGSWDTNGLPHCAYTIRLRAADSAVLNCNSAISHHSEFTVSVEVGACEFMSSTNNGLHLGDGG